MKMTHLTALHSLKMGASCYGICEKCQVTALIDDAYAECDEIDTTAIGRQKSYWLELE